MNEDEDAPTRIIRVAAGVFSERGYKAGTVREICARAAVNVAAINYHFGDKQTLYREVLAHAFREADRRHPQDVAANTLLVPEDRLRIFIRTLLSGFLDDTLTGCYGRLMAWEIANPTGALEHVIETVMLPWISMLRDLLPRIVGGNWSHADIDRFIYCILGQCMIYRQSRPLIDRFSAEITSTPDAVDRTAEIICRFSLAALGVFSHAET